MKDYQKRTGRKTISRSKKLLGVTRTTRILLYMPILKWYLSPQGGELPNVGYTGMCHQPGSIFHLQKSRTGPKFLKFYSRTGSFLDNLVSNPPAQMSKIPVAFVICFLQPDVFIFVLQSVLSFL